jgi:hypothetical protein
MMADQAYESAYEDLGAAMLAAGFKGSLAMGLASLLSIDVLSNFRWVWSVCLVRRHTKLAH